MNPIFKEYLQFLKDTTKQELPPELKEGYFWLDRQIIKGFDTKGNIHKFYRIKISDDLETVELTQPKGYEQIKDVNLSNWSNLIRMNMQRLIELETNSLQLIKDKMNKFYDYTPIIPVSMGKDSMVTAYLVRKLYPATKAIFNNTSLDCADTYIMAKSYPNCEIMNPDKGFYRYVETYHMIPTRFARFCCSIFKVGVMVSQLDKEHKYLHFMGMRNEESSTRSGYEDEWINETEWGKTNWQGILPIRKWTELDIWLYTLLYEKNIEINPKYKKGYARCGCHIACPYYTKSTWILDKYWYKNEYERWRNIIRKDFIDNKKRLIMNCTIDEYITQAWNGGTFRSKPTSEVIAEFANYNNIDVDVAARYFNKYCIDCEKRIKDKETLSMNMKLHGRNTNIFMCKKHLSIEYGMDSDKWNEIIGRFKQSGCKLF